MLACPVRQTYLMQVYIYSSSIINVLFLAFSYLDNLSEEGHIDANERKKDWNNANPFCVTLTVTIPQKERHNGESLCTVVDHRLQSTNFHIWHNPPPPILLYKRFGIIILPHIGFQSSSRKKQSLHNFILSFPVYRFILSCPNCPLVLH